MLVLGRFFQRKQVLTGFYMALLIAIHPTQAADLTINYVGEVTQSACVIDGGNTITVNMGSWKTEELTEVNKKQIKSKGPELVLRGCPQSGVRVEVTGKSDPDLPSALELSNPGTPGVATGVAIAPLIDYMSIKSGGNTWINMPKHQSSLLSLETDQTFKIGISGAIVRTSQSKPVKAGTAQGVMQITFMYN